MVAMGTLIVILYFSTEMRKLVDLATILSFLTSPFLANLNYKLIYSHDFPATSRPNLLIKSLSIVGMIFLGIFSLVFIANKLGLIF